jgi:tetrahydromethanopterin S-methyltransferase subunit E
MVLIKMFQNDQTVMGIVCIVGICVCGLGGLLAFILGWMNSTKWGIKNVMLAWTAAIILNILLGVIGAATGAIDYQAQYQQFMPK